MSGAAAGDDQELLDLLLWDEAGVAASEIPKVRTTGPAPLSRGQARLWFLQNLSPSSSLYHIPCAVKLIGYLDVPALCAALNTIMQRHESLRTCFPSVEGKPSMEVWGECRLDVPLADLTGLSELELSRRCAEEVSRPFDLARAPLMRVKLFKRGEREHVAVLVLHHIVADGWSMAVLLQELNTLYEAYLSGLPASLPPLKLQYSDFARWQAHWLGHDASESRAWWAQQLADLAPLSLPTDRGPPSRRNDAGCRVAFQVPEPTVAALKQLGRQEGASLYMLLLAAFAVLLSRYTSQTDIAVGSPVANRSRREFEPLIGFFVNTLVLRCDLSGQPSFREVVRRVRNFTLQALSRGDFPFDELVKTVAPEREVCSNPLFQVMFSVENVRSESLRLAGLTVEPLDVTTETAKFDLLLNLVESEQHLVGAFEYATDLFDMGTVSRLAEQYGRLLAAVGEEPEADIALVPLLGDSDYQRMLFEWNDNRTDYPADCGLAELFERQVSLNPDATALEFDDQILSYRDLNRRANRLARHLRKLGVAREIPVAVHMRRSEHMVVGLLAILKAGGYYVPLDTEYPHNRLRLMMHDCQARILISQTELKGSLGDHELAEVWVDDTEAWGAHSDGNLDNARARGGQLAYVIYTSGSTGMPKGVAVPQRAVARLVLDSNYIQIQPDDRIAQNSNTSFDAATFEIWGALLNGAALVGVGRDLALAPQDFTRFLRERGITALFLTTALFNQMARDVPDGFGSLRHLLFGGEAVEPESVRSVLRAGPPQRLLHVYGPTENTTFSTWYLVRDVPNNARTVPIGVALANTQVYVLDPRLRPVPIGVPGELYLGGEGLARGYLNRPDLTDLCFIDSPFGSGQRLYRTGDMVRWLSEGNLEFIGRRDAQVKIRGFRIELAEIEAWLSRHGGIRDAVVLAREVLPGHRELVAYVEGLNGAGTSELQLRAAMAKDLPNYMVPARIVFLDRLPLNANGKIDRAALPLPEDTVPEQHEVNEHPQSEVETTLLEVWRDVLGRRYVRVSDNYFQLGGDSITAIQLVSRIKREGWEVTVRDLFEHPTVRTLAPKIRRADSKADRKLEANGDVVPLTPIQAWYFREHAGSSLQHFNQSILLKPAERLDAGHLQRSLQALWRQHDALRLTYVFEGGKVLQRIDNKRPSPEFELLDLRDELDANAKMESHSDRLQTTFDLSHGPLFKAVLFRLDDADRLLLVIHHLAVDGVSWRILLDELQFCYRQCVLGGEVALGDKSDTFQQWALQMESFASSPAILAARAYWAGIHAHRGSVPLLGMEHTGPNRYGDCQSVQTQFSADQTTSVLTGTHQAYGTDVDDLLLSALALALKSRNASDYALITLEGHGRERLDVELELSRTVGWFTNCYPFLLPLTEGDLADQICAVRDARRRVPQRGLSYGILRYLTPAELSPGLEGECRPQVSFNYLGQFEGGSESGWAFASESIGRAISPAFHRAHELEVVGIVNDGRLAFSILYHPQRHQRESVQQLLDDFRDQLLHVAAHCRNQIQAKPAAREFTFVQMSEDDLDRILQSFEHDA